MADDNSSEASLSVQLGLFRLPSISFTAVLSLKKDRLVLGNIDLTLHTMLSKKNTTPEAMKELTERHIDTHYADRPTLWTDASKAGAKVGIGIYAEGEDLGVVRQYRLTDDVAIERAELQALNVALGIILDKARTGPNYGNTPLICTDSLGALQAIEADNQARLDIVKEVFNSLEALAEEEVTPTLLWVPSHCDIQGNEEADRLAKGALGNE